MKHLFTQLGAAVIMLFALTSTATAQALVGLPEFGVLLSGTPGNTVVENRSGQTIIGHALRIYYGDGTIPMNAVNFKARDIWLGHSKGLQTNSNEIPLTRLLEQRMQINGRPLIGLPTKVTLDSVIFASGEMVGPDIIRSFPKLIERVAALKDLAGRAAMAGLDQKQWDAFWQEVDRIRTTGTSGPNHYKFALASDFHQAHNSADSVSPLEIANRVMAIPTPWRKTQ